MDGSYGSTCASEPQTPHDKPAGQEADKESISTLEAMKEMGTTNVPGIESDIHCLTIVGQVEVHLILPPQNKTTKYEHILP